MPRRVAIRCLHDAFPTHLNDFVAVAVDVARASTTAVTAVALGRRCFPVASIEAAVATAKELDQPLLVGELGGNMPYGFDLTNSPASLAARTDVSRPMVLLSTSGTRLIVEAPGPETYVACLRNYSAQVAVLLARHPAADIALLGAATRGEFREEDQLCCTRMALALIQAGYEPDRTTASVVERWRDAPLEAIATGKSADYLRSTGQHGDLAFILRHVDDIGQAFRFDGREIVAADAL